MFLQRDAALLAAAISLVATGGIPTFDVEAHCRDVASRAAPVGQAEICLRLERAARDRLAREWPSFGQGDKSHCLELSRLGEPTYTELLTCLELAREARNLRERDRSTTGESR